MTRLCRSENSSQFVCDFAELVMTHMLVIEDTEGKYSSPTATPSLYPTKRIKATKLAVDMEAFIGRPDRYYAYPPKTIPDLLKHHEARHVIRIHQTFQQLKKEGRKKFEYVSSVFFIPA